MSYHMIGIGGIGMSALATILLEKGVPVSGSDPATGPIIEELKKKGALIYSAQNESQVSAGNIVVYSTDIKENNPEFKAAKEKGCRLLHRSDLLRELMNEKKTLAVTGTHGKTSTTALLSKVLRVANLDPAFVVGGIAADFGTNGQYGTGEYFVAEADESDGSFLNCSPYGAIVTNLEEDHMDFFKDTNRLHDAFKLFMEQVEAHLFYWGDDPILPTLAPRGVSYGFSDRCELRGSNFRQNGWMSEFDIQWKGKQYNTIQLNLPGWHYACNALGVFGLALSLGVDEGSIRKAFKEFRGVARRCEKKGEKDAILFLDDYAHHPTEIKATLKSIRDAIGERRLVALFQPHRYSRTRDCWAEFPKIFNDVDELIVTDIYGARETELQGIHGETLRAHIGKGSFIPRERLIERIAPMLRPHDVVVTLGAGDITHLSAELIKQPVTKLKAAVICGGWSVEHVISLISARFALASLDPSLYDVVLIGIDRGGVWQMGEAVREAVQNETEIPLKNGPAIPPEIAALLQEIDIAIPILHGTNGEDGSIQGLFEMLGVAYTGCDVRASAIAMDKDLCKAYIASYGIQTAPWIKVTARNSEVSPSRYPVYVKPAHLGSSIGVTRVETAEELGPAIEHALSLDSAVLIEDAIDGRELEFNIYGGQGDVYVFPPCEVLKAGREYSFHYKYGVGTLPIAPIADIPPEKIEEGREIAEKVYRLIGCEGFCRIEFFYKDGVYSFNEANPIPGLTPTSAYPIVLNHHKVPGGKILDQLAIHGLHRKRRRIPCGEALRPIRVE